ncbi:uncharacterized protein LOC129200837 [Grus americana]|uniref:uncharacterized protein LOC129200837 n=1 Tax=Grus americana TaxID=9117 RepID=UPI002408261D|nr:uncharacterized protein LOC129200837 [Grus americana]XP_054668058.1 uncharacterized protein LOC129200837 [Grus americana]
MLSEITKSVKFPVPLLSLSHSLVLRHVAFFEAVEATPGAMGCQNQVLLPVAGFAYLRRLCVPACVSLSVPQSLSSLLCSALFRCVCPVPCPTFILPSFFLAFFFVLLSCSPTLFLAPSDRPFPGTFVSLLLAPVFLSPLPSPRLPLLSLCPSVLLLPLPLCPAPCPSCSHSAPASRSPVLFPSVALSFYLSFSLLPSPVLSRSRFLFLFSVALSCSPCRCPSPYLSVRLPALILFSSLAVALPAQGRFCLSVPLPVLVCRSPSRCLSSCRFFLPLCQAPCPRPSLAVPFLASCFLARRRRPPHPAGCPFSPLF